MRNARLRKNLRPCRNRPEHQNWIEIERSGFRAGVAA
jgi:hypothetical protein